MLRELEESHAQLERQSIQMTRLAVGAAEQQHTAEAASVGEVTVPGLHQPRAAHAGSTPSCFSRS